MFHPDHKYFTCKGAITDYGSCRRVNALPLACIRGIFVGCASVFVRRVTAVLKPPSWITKKWQRLHIRSSKIPTSFLPLCIVTFSSVIYVLTSYSFQSFLAIQYSTSSARVNCTVGGVVFVVSQRKDLNDSTPSSSPTVMRVACSVPTVSSFCP